MLEDNSKLLMVFSKRNSNGMQTVNFSNPHLMVLMGMHLQQSKSVLKNTLLQLTNPVLVQQDRVNQRLLTQY